MAILPEEIFTAWESREGPSVLCTVNSKNEPNAIYASYVGIYDIERFYIVNHFMNKTHQNIEAGSKGSLLFFSDDQGAYQIKGSFIHLEQGEEYQKIIQGMPEGLPSKEVILLVASEVYTGSKRVI